MNKDCEYMSKTKSTENERTKEYELMKLDNAEEENRGKTKNKYKRNKKVRRMGRPTMKKLLPRIQENLKHNLKWVRLLKARTQRNI